MSGMNGSTVTEFPYYIVRFKLDAALEIVKDKRGFHTT